MKDELREWINNWKYGNNITDLKVKVLFINLFDTNKVGDKLIISQTRHSFRSCNIQLDHIEANNPNSAAEEKYFKPIKPGEQRDYYVNGIGNFMIMDDEDNNDKNDLPLYIAIDYYDKMAPGHWLIEEIKDMLKDDAYTSEIISGTAKCRVPKEEFFLERKNRLLKYFIMILDRKMDDTELNWS